MWSVEEIVSVPVELDFSSSGQGRRSATAIEALGVRLINAIEFLDVESSATQVEICECCGFSHCKAGGWVAFRRIGASVVWIPAWHEMEKGPWELSEYRPPSFLSRRGVPVFGVSSWDHLRSIHAGLPGALELPMLDSRDAARLCQWSAPGRVLGEFPAEPRLRREALLAVTDGELAAEADVVDRCLQESCAVPRPMEMVPSSIPIVPIEFWLDLPANPGWRSFAHVHDQVGFLVEDNLALLREGGLTTACS
jgi:hypothetical protein